jgi:hypothetical protein
MEERVMSKQEVVEETIKILGSIELPMIMSSAISSIQGSIRNLRIVNQMMKAEEEMGRTKDENHNAE